MELRILADDDNVAADAAPPVENEIYTGDKSQLTENATLTRLRLVVNRAYKILICIDPACGIVLTEKWLEHLRRSHRIKPLLEDVDIVTGLLADCPPPQEFGSDPTFAPVQGLPIHTGFGCTHCDLKYCSSSADSIKTHTSEVHRGEKVSSEECDFQSKAKRGKTNHRVRHPSFCLSLSVPLKSSPFS